MISVCLVVYQRPHRVKKIMEQLLKQTVDYFDVYIWDNTGNKAKLDIGAFPKEKCIIHKSESNIGSQARFRLAAMTTGKQIIFIDDDMNLKPDFIEYNYTQHMKFGFNCVLGWYSKKFNSEDYRDANGRLPCGQKVDYIGTGGMIIDREIFDTYTTLQDLLPEFAKCEDLYLCYLAQKFGMKMISIDSKCSIENDGLDQYGKLKKYKQDAFKLLRGKGYRLLRDDE